MARMTFEVSEKEFNENVKQLSLRLSKKVQDPVNGIVTFFQNFMINMKNEEKLGYYDYELRVGERSISLDDPDSDLALKELVVKALTS